MIVAINGVRIGIASVGDQPGPLAKSLRELEFKCCAVIVCASSTANQFKAVIEHLVRAGYEIEWNDKQKVGNSKSERDAANLRMAENYLPNVGICSE